MKMMTMLKRTTAKSAQKSSQKNLKSISKKQRNNFRIYWLLDFLRLNLGDI
jgi:hypothetical protein